MEIILKANNEKSKTVNFTFTNEEYNNLNFVGLIIGDEEYDLPIDELYEAICAFKRIKEVADA